VKSPAAPRICRGALVLAAGALFVPVAHGALHPDTTAPPPVANIKITITDAGIHMSPKLAQRGTIGRFILVNTGKKAHTFELGHQRRGTGTQTGFKKSLKPHQQSILILFLDYRGPIPYRGTLPADRDKPRMKGIFRVI
jgi:hypothetical protein